MQLALKLFSPKFARFFGVDCEATIGSSQPRAKAEETTQMRLRF
jgi:hypothetical protein